MKTATTTLDLRPARTLDEALRILADDGPRVPLAGCTDVLVNLHFGTTSDRRFINIWGVDELRGISADGGVLRLGALTTYTEMIRSDLVREWLPAMVAASREVGGVQIQNRGTIAGNIANGSPAADSLPVLAVADAVVVLRSVGGERRVPVNQLYT
ncbi:FAD binding domain-containing protein, partial [Longimicrobium sp.]|uniref:FAD binding domain-containing protein n=1 Tax=Longimicrobium sp. TaxID=2029185 RepID=UPI002F91DF77